MKEKIDLSLRLSLTDGTIESDPSLRELTMEDAAQLIFNRKGVVFEKPKNSGTSVPENVGILG